MVKDYGNPKTIMLYAIPFKRGWLIFANDVVLTMIKAKTISGAEKKIRKKYNLPIRLMVDYPRSLREYMHNANRGIFHATMPKRWPDKHNKSPNIIFKLEWS